MIGNILPKYKQAIREKGFVQREDGLYTSFFALKQGKAMPARMGAHTAWQVYHDMWIQQTDSRLGPMLSCTPGTRKPFTRATSSGHSAFSLSLTAERRFTGVAWPRRFANL